MKAPPWLANVRSFPGRTTMIRLKALVIKTLLLLILEIAVFSDGANAQQKSEVEKVKATLDEFHTAQSMLDSNDLNDVADQLVARHKGRKA
jgi:hypothetical protein